MLMGLRCGNLSVGPCKVIGSQNSRRSPRPAEGGRRLNLTRSDREHRNTASDPSTKRTTRMLPGVLIYFKLSYTPTTRVGAGTDR